MWRDVGRLAALLGVVVLAYTGAVRLFSPDDLFGWLSTLLSTVLSVFSALVVGLALFRYQTRQADRKKTADLAGLLETELSEVMEDLVTRRTRVPTEGDVSAFIPSNVKVEPHYAHPLIVEEAARSGLFGREQMSLMLSLARAMRAHNLRVSEALALLPNAGKNNEQYAEAGRAVRRSEECIVDLCGKLLDGVRGANPVRDDGG